MTQDLTVHSRWIDKARVTEQTIEGRAYLVMPLIAAKEGVMNGFLLPAQELGNVVAEWNDIPLTVHHPVNNQGRHVSARSADKAAAVIGRLHDVSFDGVALRGVAHIDVQKAERLGGEALTALNALRSQTRLDVSTGYFCDVEETAGQFNGADYIGIHRNLRPDHVAILPGVRGACSWSDGCGIPRVNQLHVNLDASLDNVSILVAAAWYAEFAPTPPDDVSTDHRYIWEVWEEFVITRESDGRLFRYDYTVTGTTVTFGSPIEVLVEYKPMATNKKDNGGDIVSDSTSPVAGNAACEDDASPTANSEATSALAANADVQMETEAVPVDGIREIRLLLDVLAEFGGVDGFREAIAELKTNADQERAALLASLNASGTAFSPADLNAFSTAALRKLSKTLALPAPDFSGASFPVSNQRNGEWERYVTPTLEEVK